MKLKSERLTFTEIADRWAKEVADEPGGLSYDEISDVLFRGVVGGQFADGTLARTKPPLGGAPIRPSPDVAHRPKPRFVDSSHEPTGEIRWQTLCQEDMRKIIRPGVSANLREWSDQRMARDLHIDDLERITRRVLMEDIYVTREAFNAWCDQHGHQRPAFWFGIDDTPETPESAGTGFPGRPSSIHRPGRKTDADSQRMKIINAFLEMVKHDKVSFEWGGQSAAINTLHKQFESYKPDSIKKIIAGEYKEARSRYQKG